MLSLFSNQEHEAKLDSLGDPLALLNTQALAKAQWMAIQRKGQAGKPIGERDKACNKRIASPQARVEHVFASLAQMGGKTIRSIVRAQFVPDDQISGVQPEKDVEPAGDERETFVFGLIDHRSITVRLAEGWRNSLLATVNELRPDDCQVIPVAVKVRRR